MTNKLNTNENNMSCISDWLRETSVYNIVFEKQKYPVASQGSVFWADPGQAFTHPPPLYSYTQ